MHQDKHTIHRARYVSAKCARPTSLIMSNGGSDGRIRTGRRRLAFGLQLGLEFPTSDLKSPSTDYVCSSNVLCVRTPTCTSYSTIDIAESWFALFGPAHQRSRAILFDVTGLRRTADLIFAHHREHRPPVLSSLQPVWQASSWQ